MQHFLKILLIFSGLAFPLFCSGQNLTPGELLSSSSNLTQWKNGRLNAAFSAQLGNGNSIDIGQINNTGVETNLVRTYQDGNLNLIQINQIGQNIIADVLQQGNGNKVASVVQGTDIRSTLIQNGNGNSIVQNIENSSAINTRLTQNGDNNLIEQTVIGKTNMSYQLTQNGNGLQAKITQIAQ